MTIARGLAQSIAKPLARSLSGLGSGGGGSPAPTLMFLQGATSATDATEYTFSAQSLGDAASDRRIVVCVHTRAGGNVTVSGVTVGGVAASSVVAVQSTTLASASAIYVASVPTGTTGDVVVTLSRDVLRCAIQMYRLTGVSATAVDTGSSTADPLSTSLDVPDNSIVIACASVAATTDDCVWTGVVQDYDAAVEALTTSSASQEVASASSVSVVADFTSTSAHLMIAAAFA